MGSWKKTQGAAETADMFILSSLALAALAATDTLYSLVVDPVDTAIMQPQGLSRWSFKKVCAGVFMTLGPYCHVHPKLLVPHDPVVGL